MGEGGGVVLTGCNILYVLGLREFNVIVQVQCRVLLNVREYSCNKKHLSVMSSAFQRSNVAVFRVYHVIIII